MKPNRILECVPNFSEGRDQVVINKIASAIRQTPGVSLLHVDSSKAANRTVMTFAGAPEDVTEAAYKAIEKATELIDMTKQQGVHPRIGATDVCPVVPIKNISLEEAVKYADMLAKRVGDELNIPVYLYEYSAKHPKRKALPDIRRGQYEGLQKRMESDEWKPDYGPSSFKESTGATVIGARNILVAFNVSLDTRNVKKASYIAERLRERGYVKRSANDKERVVGMFKKLRAIGWYMEDYEHAQVSMNLLDYRQTSPLEVFKACSALAQEVHTNIVGSEVIGLIPEECLLEAGAYYYIQRQLDVPNDKRIVVNSGVELLGLNKLKPFLPNEKILEYALEAASTE